jgi:shikimate kinase
MDHGGPVTLGPDQHVVLVGLMGTGKSTLGRLLAERLGRAFVDNDRELEARSGRTAREAASRDGLDALHRLEDEVLDDVLARRPGAVVAAAASVADRPGAPDHLAPHVIVWIDTPVDLIDSRLESGDRDHRPLEDADRLERLRELSARRGAGYARLATIRVAEGDGDSPADVADRVIGRLRNRD